MKKIILSILVLALISAAGIYYYAFVYSKNWKFDMVNAEAMTIDPNVLVKAFQDNEVEANKNYLDKVLLINGTVNAVDKTLSGERTVMFSTDDPFAGVIATLDTTESATINVNDKVTLKGFCKGFLSDVVITSAIVVK